MVFNQTKKTISTVSETKVMKNANVIIICLSHISYNELNLYLHTPNTLFTYNSHFLLCESEKREH